MKIYLIRHGRQNSPLCNVNVPLSPEGRRQAALLAERLKTVPLDAVWSSDLIRAVETAEIANGLWNVPHVIRPGIREISFGEMEGLSDREIVERFLAKRRSYVNRINDYAHLEGEPKLLRSGWSGK